LGEVSDNVIRGAGKKDTTDKGRAYEMVSVVPTVAREHTVLTRTLKTSTGFSKKEGHGEKRVKGIPRIASGFAQIRGEVLTPRRALLGLPEKDINA